MSGVTNRLIKEYKAINPDINNPEYDSILATGEQYSSALISTLLDNEGIKTRSLLGWQVPIITDSNYSKARIEKIDPTFIKKLFRNYSVLVVAGFQGVSNENRITTLGRGGSDTSAVALSVALNSHLSHK